jgi:hypothetical protein
MKNANMVATDDVAREWAEADMETELEARKFYRALMDRRRLMDLADDLKALEAYAQERTRYFAACQQVREFSHPQLRQMFQTLEQDQQALSGKFRALYEKLGWVLQP